MPLTEKSSNAVKAVLEMKIHEKDFLNELFEHPDFFEDGSSHHLIEFENDYQFVIKELKNIKNLEKSLNYQFKSQNLESVIKELTKYHDSFFDVVNDLKKRGFQNYGLEGEFRNEIHQIEASLQEENEQEMSSTLIEIRRNEKDFFLRHDSIYIKQQEKLINDLKQKISVSDIEDNIKNNINQQLDKYKINFDEAVKIEKDIGFTSGEGKIKEYTDSANNAILILKEHSIEENIEINEVITGTLTNLLILVSVVLFSGIILGLVMNRSISESVKQIEKTKELEKKLEISREKIKTEKFATIGELSSRLAHDIRNPLTIIISTVDLILERHKNEFVEKDTENIKQLKIAVNNITNQINNVLDFVRTRSLKLEQTNLSAILKNVVNNINRPDTIIIDLPHNDQVLKCDIKQMEIVFFNVIQNAIQAMDKKGKVAIHVSENNNEVIIKIENSGPDIPKTVLPHIFEPLFTTKQMGTGLGLVSCKNIIEQHSGSINAYNKPTRFIIKLPKSD